MEGKGVGERELSENIYVYLRDIIIRLSETTGTAAAFSSGTPVTGHRGRGAGRVVRSGGARGVRDTHAAPWPAA